MTSLQRHVEVLGYIKIVFNYLRIYIYDLKIA